MKSYAPALLAALFLTATSYGQPTPNPRFSPPAISNNGQPSQDPLTENYTITLKATDEEKTLLNLSVTGTGPQFSINTADPISALTLELGKQGDAFLIRYSFGQQIKMPTSNNSVEYKNASINGTALLSLGKPVVIATENGRKYTLMIEAAAN